ncbi:MAG TPA: hypothetical protein VNG12_17695 [Acidimicrobiales bacterium]|nr:hypothetical protein [Acidimicrobiales bacterium]
MATPRRRPVPNAAALARRRRDESLGRVTTMTKTIGVSILAATGILGLYISKALPGHSTTAPSVTSNVASSNSNGNTGSGASTSGGLAPPSSPPVQSQQPAPVVSGSS